MRSSDAVLVIGAALLVIGIGALVVSVAKAPLAAKLIDPVRFVNKPFTVANNTTIVEFRNSQGGTCILAMRDRTDALAIACMRQLPAMDYEDLPESISQHRPQ